jgi:hypothetical protein
MELYVFQNIINKTDETEQLVFSAKLRMKGAELRCFIYH